ncbi:hypothetical protein RJ45_22025 [Photobacterium gaetbulicola]|uniref:Uncharacterized protein n=1 Tax=Photobacterium gaetbulicola TaxID=1295392 RepID=A0A0B9GY69_9GAMM|nr:hypothetical protein RJ45_22025 [Photobacterium gaetbulicola]
MAMNELDGIDIRLKRRCYFRHLFVLQHHYCQAISEGNRTEMEYLKRKMAEVKQVLMSKQCR